MSAPGRLLKFRYEMREEQYRAWCSFRADVNRGKTFTADAADEEASLWAKRREELSLPPINPDGTITYPEDWFSDTEGQEEA